jgi:2-succinyl-6-hydroxy-2,4-cyclohexadiene-1-carboxylate synthase
MSLLSVQREGSGSSFVWLHGFTQTRASAHQFRSILAGSHELLTLDLPGHGSSAAREASLEETADLVVEALPDEPVALGGYSLGGRVALHIALRHPQRIDRLVLLGATRGIENASERQERRVRDEALATRIETIGTEAFLDEWLAQPLFAELAKDPLERAARSRQSAVGLANSLRRAGTGTQAWLAPRLATITAPTLALAGARDGKFSVEARAIALGVAHGSFDIIDSAGHAAHLEQPATTARRINEFLSG